MRVAALQSVRTGPKELPIFLIACALPSPWLAALLAGASGCVKTSTRSTDSAPLDAPCKQDGQEYSYVQNLESYSRFSAVTFPSILLLNMDGQDGQDEDKGLDFAFLSCTSCPSMFQFRLSDDDSCA